MWIGHFIRNNQWITFRIEGKPEKGRPKLYMKQIMLDIKKGSCKELKEVAMDRKKWRNISSLQINLRIKKKPAP